MTAKFRAWSSTDIEQNGLGRVMIARQREPGWWDVGAFLIDAWCLGVKDAYVSELATDALEGFALGNIPDDEREEIDPACARALVEGAVAYAQSLGFLPHRDFRKARKVFGSLKATDCARSFTFGREGKPCFVAGPFDDEARVNRVFAVLRARFGPDGFTYVDAIDEGPDLDDEDDEVAINTLYRFIEGGRCADPAITTSEVCGFVTALLILPDTVQPDAWLPAVWGGAGSVPAFHDDAERDSINDALLALYHRTLVDLEDGRLVIALPGPDDSHRELWARRYCVGLLRGLALDAKVLTWLRGHPEAGPQLAFVERAAAGTEPVGVDFENRVAHAVDRLYNIAGELPGKDQPPAGA